MKNLPESIEEIKKLLNKRTGWVQPEDLKEIRTITSSLSSYSRARLKQIETENPSTYFRDASYRNWQMLRDNADLFRSGIGNPSMGDYARAANTMSKSAEFLQGQGQIGPDSLEGKSGGSSVIPTVLGVGLGVFFLIDNFFTNRLIQLSPGESFNYFGWQFYSAIVLILIGIISLYFWIKGSKAKNIPNKKVSKKIIQKKRK